MAIADGKLNLHLTSKGVFVYGNIGDDKEQERHLLYPYVLSKVCSFFSYKGSRLSVEKAKESTARVAMWRELEIPAVYTIETSFYGASESHFTAGDLMEIGKNLCQAVLVYEKVLSKEKSHELAAKIIDEISISKLTVLKRRHGSEESDSESCSEDNAQQSELSKMIEPMHKGNSLDEAEAKECKEVPHSPTKRNKPKVHAAVRKCHYKKVFKRKTNTKNTIAYLQNDKSGNQKEVTSNLNYNLQKKVALDVPLKKRSELETSCRRITKPKKETETPYRNELKKSFGLNSISKDSLKHGQIFERTSRNLAKYHKRDAKAISYNKSASPERPIQAKSLLKLAAEKTYYDARRVSFDRRVKNAGANKNSLMQKPILFNPCATEAPFVKKYSNRRTSHRLRAVSSNSFCQTEKTSVWEASPCKGLHSKRRRSNDVREEPRTISIVDGGVFSYSLVTRLANKRLNEVLLSRNNVPWPYPKK